MEFMSIPGAKGRGRRLVFSTDVDHMCVGQVVGQESDYLPCLTAHYASEWQLGLMQAIAREARQARSNPKVYLNRLLGHADVIFVFRFLFQGAVARLIRGISPNMAIFLKGEGSATEVAMIGAAEFDYRTGETGFGLNEFLSLRRQSGLFLFGFFDMGEPIITPHAPKFLLQTLATGNPLKELTAR